MAARIKAELWEFLTGKPSNVGETLGQGSFGVVRKVVIDDTEYAAKVIKVFSDSEVLNSDTIVYRYIREIKQRATVRHPNIVQFCGVCEMEGSPLPAIVTEIMHIDLQKYLLKPESHKPGSIVPLTQKKSILEDVVRGLVYLHKKEIIHGDLTARNILLTPSLVAKIADIITSRLLPEDVFIDVNHTVNHQDMLLYLPPEANSPETYTRKVDMFSFGHLTLVTLTQTIPENLPSRFPCGEDYNDCSEINRREEYIELLTSKGILPDAERHPLMRIMKQCLSYRDTERPDAVEVMQMLKGVQTNSDLDESLATDCEREVEVEELMQKYASTIDRSMCCLDEAVQQMEESPACQKINELKSSLKLESEDLKKMRKKRASLSSLRRESNEDNHITRLPQKMEDPPYGMSGYPQVVVIDNHVYVGGGYASPDDAATILDFDTTDRAWRRLANCPTKFFGMAVVQKKLVIIGGVNTQKSEKSGRTFYWDEQSSTWKAFVPSSMLTPRSTPTTVTYNDEWLIAVGGEGKKGEMLSSVEKLNVKDTGNDPAWSTCPNTPVPCEHFSLAIVDDHLFAFASKTYGVGSPVGMVSNKVFHTPLHQLLDDELAEPCWQEIKDLPLKAATAVAFNGSLLALGGIEKIGSMCKSVYQLKYKQTHDQTFLKHSTWHKVSDLPCELYFCGCVQYQDTIFVHGLNSNNVPCVYLYTLQQS